MKSIDKRWILFLTLIILLASGLTFLALNQEASSKKEEENRDPKMAVALVNEDEGAVFNGEDLAFGDAFVKSMDKNNNHDWYIVSRGVAESGLTNNTYDMMIVIPNNFSQKALSIESENPEQVVLDYKINATDNEKIKAEAEKTASNILNEFNQRIIDVFFASILNNLQGAQTNIGDIIDKQSQLTNTYNNQIYGRLNNYTDQFGMIKDNTEISKDSFSGFEDKLENYENELAEDAERNQNYLSSLEEVFQMQETNTTTWQNFYEAFNQFDTTLNASEVEGQLQELQAANLAINKQFQTREEQPETPSVNTVMFRQSSNNVANIASGTAALKKHLDESLTKVEQTNADIDETLNSLDADVESKLRAFLEEAFSSEKQPLKELLRQHNERYIAIIEDQISNLPTLNINKIEDLGLTEDQLIEIRNVIKATSKYSNIDNVQKSNDAIQLEEDIDSLNQHLNTKGITMSDSVNIPNDTKSNESTFILNYSNEVYEIKNLRVVATNFVKEVEDYKGGEIALPASPGKGKFKVEFTLLTKNDNKYINMFDLATWDWTLKYDDKNETEEEIALLKMHSNPLVSTMGVGVKDIKSENPNYNPGTKNNTDEQPLEDTETSSTDEKDSTETDEETEGNLNDKNSDSDSKDKQGNENQEKPSDNSDTDQTEQSEKPTETKKVEIINNTIHHKVTSPSVDEETKGLVESVSKTISQYQQMARLYESYYGIDMEALNEKFDEIGKIEDLAMNNKGSLYYLFNHEDMEGLLSSYVVKEIADGITQEIQKPLQTLKSQIDDHQQRVQQAYQNADQLVKKVEATSKKAKVLNTNLASTLEDVSKWRERSQTLIEQQTEIQANEDGENTAIMSLGNEFEPLLTASQSLAEQTQGNLNAAENVYDTFDTIDNHAETIQESGVNLVDQAEELSVNMTNKLVEDQEFANNFTNVLANSQIGERENENLYEFLSNPVQVSNNGTISSPTGNTFNPYYLVLICFIVVLFTAYVISTINQKRVEQDQFTEEKSLMAANTPITMITAGIGVLEGIIIGVLSSYFLEISNVNMLLWITVVTTVTVAMLLIATYLLRQLKMIGMFLLLAIFSIYLFLTNTLGSGSEAIQMIREFSPLKLVESVLRNTVQGDMNYSVTLAIIIGLIVLGAVGNLFVTYQLRNKGDIDDESSEEAS
ncbi:type VII secretion protein EsaA [Virgibacillus salexigens]|uniref:Type VII secretion system accessory factor EsaA n=1 Tax=Virgibacillus kapii TaxID=1638645 RepID=A0ABQ2DVJ6_9BACI|nr:type VII secretion protein EsaA [Virgibacillus kapii]GGJ74573.1 type VII secretion protein EsaA [Virgibacillus kapii]